MSKENSGFGQVTDEMTLAAAASGQLRAQKIIFERYKNAVLRTLIGLCHDRDLARDLAQDAFLQAFSKLHQVRNYRAFGGWLKQLTIRTALSYFRAQPPVSDTFQEDTIESEQWSTQADWLIQLRDIETLIAQLNNQERLTVWLYLGEGYNHEEIAELLDEQAATVRKRYQRALAKLHDFLTNNEVLHDH
ncbi:RNA polymerase sigma-70 factor, ECF subfamily [Pseudidiomarina maritima]|uniref:RNA polymerase sigma-70 factor, ECF subfamily n=1 Tax=Pseudidiomarina maritima TaxID=519453 RepID=A0A1I6G6M0_9GAMM|nr:sigma-70 family RNA polymerase sigma factor [Pseudidiomarina maritima]SFR37829.1 RNA polymerase sigma-70 factor, ECF subfamily [Pseudidiomarina maritima]